MVTLALLLSCADGEPSAEEGLSLTRQLTRVSLDTRGQRPTPDEIAAVLAAPALLDQYVDSFLLHEGFPERVKDVYQEVLRSRSELYPQDPLLFVDADAVSFYASVGEETLAVIGRVAEEDLPYTELVTGDWTMADPLLASMWPVDYPEGAEGWRAVHYTDGRPAAGLLSTNGFYWRYDSTLSNANRKRANAISSIFLCNDFIGRPVEFSEDVDVSDPDSFALAVQTVDGCKSCHASLDPIAAHLFGFFYHFDENPDDANRYHVERERYWQDFLGGTGPSWFGQPTADVVDLGHAIASDPSFPGCAVQHVWTGLSQREPGLDDVALLTEHREAFIAGGLTLRTAWRTVLMDPRYRGEAVAGAVEVKQVSPRQLASQVEALTGYRWEVDGVDGMSSDRLGLRTLAGGLDGMEGSRRARGPNPTLVLVQQRLAEAAAQAAVEDDPAGLFEGVDLDAPPDEATLARLTLATLGEERAPGDPELAELTALWSALLELDGDPRAAWAGVLTVLLRDPNFLFY